MRRFLFLLWLTQLLFICCACNAKKDVAENTQRQLDEVVLEELAENLEDTEIKQWVETELSGSWNTWYEAYQGDTLERIVRPEKEHKGPAARADIIFYHAPEEEEPETAVKKMIKSMLEPLKETSEKRPYTMKEYRVGEQQLIQITENLWIIPYLEGWYCYDGTDLISYETALKEAEDIPEDGLVPFVRQGSGSVFAYILMRQNGVYRLQRAEDMRENQPTTTPTGVPVLEEEVSYSIELTVADSMELHPIEGKGWTIDLNRDGTPERLYADDRGIYINECWVLEPEYGRYDAFWLMDIDTEDDIIELMIYCDMAYELYCYGADGVLKCTDTNACGMYGSTSGTFEQATDIRRPKRLDNQTIAFQTASLYFDYYVMTLSYRLDETHNLRVVPQEYELSEPSPMAYIDTTQPLKLYTSRSFDSEYLEVTEPALFMVTKIDGVEWVYLSERHTGRGGWIQVAEDGMINNEVKRDAFIGYANVP